MINRQIQLPHNNSFFLFGARGVGKSTLLKQHFQSENTLWIDLLDDSLLDEYSIDPQRLRRALESYSSSERPRWVIIDEIQKCPKLLNVVHQVTESDLNVYFALTGSSARRLKQKGTNLLAGRAWVYHLFPLTYQELGESFSLNFFLNWGGLPQNSKYSSDEDRAQYLRSYTLTYLKNEIQEEQWVRKLDPFRRFLPIAAQMNGKVLNYSKIGRDTGVDANTIQSYYQILEETLVGFFLPSFHKSLRKQQRKAPKFYFFDPGVKRALERKLNIQNVPETSEYGHAFEHMVISQCIALNEYYQKDFQFFYLLTKDGFEVDLIIDRPESSPLFVEIKSKKKITNDDFRHLNRFSNDNIEGEFLILSQDPTPQQKDNILALLWTKGLDKIFS